MKHKQFGPNPRYLGKLRTIVTLIVVGSYLSMIWVAWPIALDDPDGAVIYATVLTVLAVVCWVVGIALSGPYYRSLQYEILDDEVIVHVGIVTKSVKHVPYRTVTNITVKRGLLDRFVFDLGTLNIQTAGMSGTTGAEESLQGLPNVHEIYDLVVTELRRFRSGMTPTAADMDQVAVTKETAVSAATLDNILVELQAVRHLLETKQV